MWSSKKRMFTHLRSLHPDWYLWYQYPPDPSYLSHLPSPAVSREGKDWMRGIPLWWHGRQLMGWVDLHPAKASWGTWVLKEAGEQLPAWWENFFQQCSFLPCSELFELPLSPPPAALLLCAGSAPTGQGSEHCSETARVMFAVAWLNHTHWSL